MNENLFYGGLRLFSLRIAEKDDNDLEIGSAFWRVDFETGKRRYSTQRLKSKLSLIRFETNKTSDWKGCQQPRCWTFVTTALISSLTENVLMKFVPCKAAAEPDQCSLCQSQQCDTSSSPVRVCESVEPNSTSNKASHMSGTASLTDTGRAQAVVSEVTFRPTRPHGTTWRNQNSGSSVQFNARPW